MRLQQQLVNKRRQMDEDEFYVSLKASIDQATNQEDLYRAYIDLIIFKHNYHGYHARTYKAKLEGFYNKKLIELKEPVMN